MAVREVGVWLDDVEIAILSSSKPGRITCRYTKTALHRWPEGTPVLSCSLPLGPGRADAYAFAAGLLPEGQHRQAMASMAGVATTDVLGMLSRFGRDVAGAISIGEIDGATRTPRVEPYSDETLLQAVSSLGEHPLGLYDDTELSIAGLQDKMLVVESPDGTLGRPVNGFPSTHILKLDNRLFPGLVRAEHQCLQLARAAGVSAAESRLLSIGPVECILVQRFDRTTDADGTVHRMHQEDACQALGIDPEDNQRRAKYEGDGGPGFRDIAALLGAWAIDPEAQLAALLEALVFTVLIGNADAHGKNVGLLHRSVGAIELAPLYDTVPTMLWPTLRAEAAMRVGSTTSLVQVSGDDFVRETGSWPINASDTRATVSSVISRVLAALDAGEAVQDERLTSLIRNRGQELMTLG